MDRHRRYGWRIGDRPKIKGLGETSAHWYIAMLSVETGIAPSALMQESERMLWTLGKAVEARNSAKQGLF